MPKLPFLSASAGLAAFLLLPHTSSAAFIVTIDDYSSGSQTLSLSGQPPGTVFETATGSPSAMIGGEREAIFVLQANPFEGEATASLGSGQAVFDLDPFVDTELELYYDGAGNSGLGGTDFSIGSSIGLELVSAEFTIEAGIELTDQANATVSLLRTTPGAILSPETLTFEFVDFTGDAGFDWTSIDAVRFTLDPSDGTDLVIGGIGVQAVPVPEPSALALVGITLGLMLRRRR